MRRIVVLKVIDDLGFGGAQRQVVEIANNLDPSRFDVHVCSLSRSVPLAVLLTNRSTQLHIVSKRGRFDATVISRLSGLLTSLGADLVHSYFFDADIAARLAGRRAGTRAIIGSVRN